jgi:hypothetical protein
MGLHNTVYYKKKLTIKIYNKINHQNQITVKNLYEN